MKYTLMHLDREVAILDISDDSGYIKESNGPSMHGTCRSERSWRTALPTHPHCVTGG